MSNVFFVLYFYITIHYSETANILAIFPTPSISHQVVFRPLMHELVKRGHRVTIITTDPAFNEKQRPANLTEIDVHDISYKIWQEYALTANGDDNNLEDKSVIFLSVIFNLFERQLMSVDVQKLINDKNKKFDLLFLEHFSRPILSYSYIYKVPVITFNSFGPTYDLFDSIDTAIHPLVYPAPPLQRFYNLTVWEKLSQWYLFYVTYKVYCVAEKNEIKQIKRIFGPEIPEFSELKNNVHLTFLNTHRIWDNNRPVPPNLIYVGGIRDNPAHDLPKDLQSYLDKSTKGVVYMSFGSIIQTSLFSQEIIELFIDVFSKLPYNVLIKWDSELPGCPDNVKVGKWFPQTDLLRHKNVKLFITHVGYQSMSESIDAGIPIVGIPMAADEWYNMELCLKHGIGVKLDFKYLTKQNIKGAINTVIGNECYRDNIIRLRNLIHDQPQSPLDLAVWWTEYVLRHGGATHLRSAAAHMRWTEYYEINLILCLLLLILIFTFSIIYSVKLFINKLVSGQSISTTKCTPNTAMQRCNREKMQ